MSATRTFEPVERRCEGKCETCVNDEQHRERPATVEAPAVAPVSAKPVRSLKRILVAVDHEQHPAVETALLLATALHAQVAIIHALEPIPPLSDSAYAYTQTIQERRGYAVDLLKAIQKAVPENARAFTCLREGAAPTEIVAAAAEWNADLIVIGTHRRGAVARLLLGSTSQAVLRHATCPVLLVADVPAPEPVTPATV